MLALFSIVSNAQIPYYNLPPNNHYKKGYITLKDFTKYEGDNIYLLSDSIAFKNLNSSLDQKIPFSTIDYLRLRVGTKAQSWSIFAGTFVGITGIFITLNDSQRLKPGAAFFILPLTSAAIGGLIGATVPRWKTFYLH
jgi:hypothetical protein